MTVINSALDDQSFALHLQLQEISAVRNVQAGKWVEDRPPDYISAFDIFADELRQTIALVADMKLAHSISAAVESDGKVIEESTVEEEQCAQDRQLALSWNNEESPPSRYLLEPPKSVHAIQEDTASTVSAVSCSTVAGPSVPYSERRTAASSEAKIMCIVCSESSQPDATVRLLCGDVYCKPCLRSFLLRVIKDESLFPPKCHHKLIGMSVIENILSAEELKTYRHAELEYTSTDRVYCAVSECGNFILPQHRKPDYASCVACGAETCLHCKALAHEGACAADESRQILMAFATDKGWRECFGCGEMVSRDEGCDHMTCRCRAEFCYRCGAKWKECPCGDWVPELLHQRAQQVVDREAPEPLLPAARQRRVAAMEQELQENHECYHGGKFTKIAGSRRGHVCEICGTRHWKYILSCRRCHMLACEDCRRYRV